MVATDPFVISGSEIKNEAPIGYSILEAILAGDIGVKIPEVVHLTVGLKSAVTRRISRNWNQLSQVEASHWN